MALQLPVIPQEPDSYRLAEARIRRCTYRRLVQDWQPLCLSQVLELLERHGTLDRAREFIHEYLYVARQSLNPLPDSDHRTRLCALTEYLAQQTDALGDEA